MQALNDTGEESQLILGRDLEEMEHSGSPLRDRRVLEPWKLVRTCIHQTR